MLFVVHSVHSVLRCTFCLDCFLIYGKNYSVKFKMLQFRELACFCPHHLRLFGKIAR